MLLRGRSARPRTGPGVARTIGEASQGPITPETSPSGQGLGYGVQGQPYACSYHGAVEADELQVGPEEQL